MLKVRQRVLVVALVAVCCAALAAQYRDPDTWQHRDTWQRPDEVMDALQITRGSAVADIGAGEGYFTDRLARRVGPTGDIYAVDIDPAALRMLRELKQREHYQQVEVVEGEEDNPRLPPHVIDAVLVVNAYHEFRQHDAMLRAFAKALVPGGRLGIIEKADKPGEAREAYERRHHLPESFVREDLARNGFGEVAKITEFHPTGSREGETWYFLVARSPNQ